MTDYHLLSCQMHLQSVSGKLASIRAIKTHIWFKQKRESNAKTFNYEKVKLESLYITTYFNYRFYLKIQAQPTDDFNPVELCSAWVLVLK